MAVFVPVYFSMSWPQTRSNRCSLRSTPLQAVFYCYDRSRWPFYVVEILENVVQLVESAKTDKPAQPLLKTSQRNAKHCR